MAKAGRLVPSQLSPLPPGRVTLARGERPLAPPGGSPCERNGRWLLRQFREAWTADDADPGLTRGVLDDHSHTRVLIYCEPPAPQPRDDRPGQGGNNKMKRQATIVGYRPLAGDYNSCRRRCRDEGSRDNGSSVVGRVPDPKGGPPPGGSGGGASLWPPSSSLGSSLPPTRSVISGRRRSESTIGCFGCLGPGHDPGNLGCTLDPRAHHRMVGGHYARPRIGADHVVWCASTRRPIGHVRFTTHGVRTRGPRARVWDRPAEVWLYNQGGR